jgi:hypothetical protein
MERLEIHTGCFFFSMGKPQMKRVLGTPNRRRSIILNKVKAACRPVVPKVGGTAPWGAVGLQRWALRGGRERCYYHRGALVDK